MPKLRTSHRLERGIMIDEKKLIDRFRKLRGIDSLANMFINDVIKEIEKQSKIGEWIPCSERLPEEKINPVTSDFYEYQVTFRSEDVTDVRHYKFGRGHWWNGPGTVDKYVIAWQPLPEPYKP